MIEARCHCGAVRLLLTNRVEPASITVRICGCDFCRRHAPRWWSDPAGELLIEDAEHQLCAYRFGTKTADFLFCSRCGCLMAAICWIDGREYAVINLNNAEGVEADKLPTASFDYDGEDQARRLARRQRNWMPVAGGVSASSG